MTIHKLAFMVIWALTQPNFLLLLLTSIQIFALEICPHLNSMLDYHYTQILFSTSVGHKS